MICYVNSREHVRKWLCDLMGESLSPSVAILQSLLVIGLSEDEIERFLFATWNHGQELLILSNYCARLEMKI